MQLSRNVSSTPRTAEWESIRSEGSPQGKAWNFQDPALRQMSFVRTGKEQIGFGVMNKTRMSFSKDLGPVYTNRSPRFTVLPKIPAESGISNHCTSSTGSSAKLADTSKPPKPRVVPGMRKTVSEIERHVALGNTDNIPELPRKSVKVYVSSNYDDMKEERFALHKVVTPKLQNFCRNLGLDFQFVDLHRGKSPELAEELTTYAVNQSTIESCATESVATCFLSLVGTKYGCPVFPPRLDFHEFGLLMSHLDEECQPIVRHWFRLDDSAQPPCYALQLYTDDAAESAVFLDTLWMVPELLYMAAYTAHQHESMDQQQAASFKKSELESDLELAARLASPLRDRCAVFLRDIDSLQSALAEDFALVKQYTDVDEDYAVLDEGAALLLSQFKERLREGELSAALARSYTVPWCPRRGIHPASQVEHTNYLYTLCLDVESHIRWQVHAALEAAAPSSPSHPSNPSSSASLLSSPALDPPLLEVLHHAHFIKKQSQLAVEVPGVMESLRTLLYRAMHGDELDATRRHAPVVLYGPQGAGKRIVMAAVHERLPRWFGAEVIRITRFVGLTSASTNLYDLLISLCQQLTTIFAIRLPEGLEEMPVIKVTALFHKILKKISAQYLSFGRPLFILLASLDGLAPGHNAHNPAWLPVSLPPFVYVLVSTLQQGQHSIYSRLVLLLKNQDCFLKIQGLSPPTARALIERYEARAQRYLTEEQKLAILNMGQHAASSPMYLSLILSQAQQWNSLVIPCELELGRSISAAVQQLFDGLVLTHGQPLVAHALGFISVSLGGLTESELEDALSLSDDLLAETLEFSAPPPGGVVRFPALVWARLKHDVTSYLRTRYGDGKYLLTWSHDVFTKVSIEKLLPLSWSRRLHSTLFELFSADKPVKRPLSLKHGTLRKLEVTDRQVCLQPLVPNNTRKLRALPFHLARSRAVLKWRGTEPRNPLADYHFLSTKLRALGMRELLQDIDLFATGDPHLSVLREFLEGHQRAWARREEQGRHLARALCTHLEPVISNHQPLRPLLMQARAAWEREVREQMPPGSG